MAGGLFVELTATLHRLIPTRLAVVTDLYWQNKCGQLSDRQLLNPRDKNSKSLRIFIDCDHSSVFYVTKFNEKKFESNLPSIVASIASQNDVTVFIDRRDHFEENWGVKGSVCQGWAVD